MKICSYCQLDKPLTREHIIPSWYYKHDPSPNDTGFNERAKGKIVSSELVIRDVCADCNNGELSALDRYGKELFLKFFTRYVFLGARDTFDYDFELLVRWLLKVSFNSARAHNSDTEILSQYRDVIGGHREIPAKVFVHLRTIAPATGDLNKQGMAQKESEASDYPDWFRVGVFRVKNFDSMYWAFRHVTINSYSFALYIPDIANIKEALEVEQELRAAIKAEPYESLEVCSTGRVHVPQPFIDSISFNLNHLGQFPLTYNLVQNEFLQTALDQKTGLVNYWIDREDIESGDTSATLSFLNDLLSSREVCDGMKERIEFSVHGYDGDPREIFEIPEVVRFINELDQAWPYWMLFQHPKFSWLQVAAVCLSDPTRNSSGSVSFDHEKYCNLMTKWFEALNELSHRFAISLTTNKRVSQNAADILMRGFDKS